MSRPVAKQRSASTASFVYAGGTHRSDDAVDEIPEVEEDEEAANHEEQAQQQGETWKKLYIYFSWVM